MRLLATEVLLERSFHPTEIGDGRGRRRSDVLVSRIVKGDGMKAQLGTTHIQIHPWRRGTVSIEIGFVQGRSSECN